LAVAVTVLIIEGSLVQIQSPVLDLLYRFVALTVSSRAVASGFVTGSFGSFTTSVIKVDSAETTREPAIMVSPCNDLPERG
jgi:hypothetical protein